MSGSPAEGWYQDPERPGWVRWWDGSEWSEWRQPGTAQSGVAAPRREPSRLRLLVALIVVALMAVGVVTIAMAINNEALDVDDRFTQIFRDMERSDCERDALTMSQRDRC